ncbi:MAG: hypothetical protein GY830_07630, partial [Bacteroidetes bacterium]|nr:hypothetical protein [Bacteroidota bacterium]
MFIKNKIYLVLIISILIFSCLFASDFKPKIFDSNIIKKEYSHFTVYYNSKAKIPHCVYYKINHFETKYAKLRRFKNFRQDKELNTAKVTDYYKKGYDSGHLISAETASFCIDAAYDTNYMSN